MGAGGERSVEIRLEGDRVEGERAEREMTGIGGSISGWWENPVHRKLPRTYEDDPNEDS